MTENVELVISLNPSKFQGYQAKKGQAGKITLFLENIWNQASDNEDLFILMLNEIYIIERVCIQRAFEKIRMKNRCGPCKIEKYALLMCYPDEWPAVREWDKIRGAGHG